jgi:DNA-binding response OmpR family regulator
VVDDDTSYREALVDGLKAEGFYVAAAADGRDALRLFAAFNFDAVVLDLRLPDISGTEVCRQLRLTSDVPILMLSASADEVDVVLSFELGADDYVTKPLRLRELVARIDATFRHRYQASNIERLSLPRDDLDLGPLHISFDARTVDINGTRIALSRKEFDLIAALASRPGRVYTREELMETVWSSESADDRTLDTHMYRLRSKVERDARHPELIVTVRGVGFLLNDKLSAHSGGNEKTAK